MPARVRETMTEFLNHLALSTSVFMLVLLGYVLVTVMKWPTQVSDGLSRFVFSIALPSMLFRMMSQRGQLPSVDHRVLIVFFGGCLIVFILGQLAAALLHHLEPRARSVYGIAGVFSNNLLLGIPIVHAAMGDAAMPAVGFLLIFNALILWTLVSVSIEWATHGGYSLPAMIKTARGIMSNPIIFAIIGGLLWSLLGRPLPGVIDAPLESLSDAAGPLALVSLGMTLGVLGWREGLHLSLGMTVMKLLVQPIVVWGLALALGLPQMETRVAVILGSLAIGVNIFLMSKQFKVIEGAAASAILISTFASALTTPMFLYLLGL